MRDKCYFKEYDKPKDKKVCTYPKIIKFCPLCVAYIKNNGNLDKNIKFINFISNKKYNYLALTLSLMAIIISIFSLLKK